MTFSGPRRARRPGRDLHVPAVAQPHLRREPRHGASRWRRPTALTRQTCEGVKSCQSILDLAHKHGVDMPITEQVVEVVHHGVSPREMLRPPDVARGQGRGRLTRRTGSYGATGSGERVEGCREVAPQVLDVLDAHRQPDERLRHRRALSAGQRRRRSRVDSTPPRLVVWTHSRTASQTRSASSAPPATLEATHATRSRPTARAPRRGPGRRAGPGSAPAPPPGAPGRRRASSPADACAALHPQRQGAQPAQREERLERPRDGAVQPSVPREPLARAPSSEVTATPSSTSECPDELLGHAVHDDVGAEVERPLDQGRGERVVDGDHGADGVRGRRRRPRRRRPRGAGWWATPATAAPPRRRRPRPRPCR